MSWLIFHHQSHYLAKFCFFSYGPKCCQPIKLQDSWKCNISRKKGMMKFIFVIQINIKVFYQLMLPFLVCIARLVQSTQNKKFAYLCNISRKTWGFKWFFCLQINTKVFYKMILSFWVCAIRVTQSTQNNKFSICNILRKKWVMRLIFCMQINMKVSYKLILWFLVGMVKHS